MKSILQSVFLVGSGGFIGAVFRYALIGAVQRALPLATFPYGTLAVNLIGCFLVGALAGIVEARQLFTPELRMLLFVGLLGGFTTFSTFGYETLLLARAGDLLRAASNVGLHVTLGLALVWIGYSITSSV